MTTAQDKLTVIYDKNHSCYNLCVTSTLSRVLDPVRYIWNQSGMVSYEGENFFEFTPYYNEVKDHLLTAFGIELKEIKHDNFDEYYRTLQDVLAAGHSVVLLVDVFDMPYIVYYKEKHNFHAIELVGIEGDEVLLCDHFYKYTGALPKETIRGVMEQVIEREYMESYDCMYFDVSKFALPPREEFLLESIRVNTEVTRGREATPIVELPGRVRKLGFEAFDALTAYLEHEVFVQRENVDISFRAIKEFSNARHHYAILIRELAELRPEVTPIADGYDEISQYAHVTANMILKLFATGQFERFQPRVMDKLRAIREKELRQLELIEEILGY